MAPKLSAARVPCQLGPGCGARQRRGPTGGAAKGMFLNASTPSSCAPVSAPCATVTDGCANAGRLRNAQTIPTTNRRIDTPSGLRSESRIDDQRDACIIVPGYDVLL